MKLGAFLSTCGLTFTLVTGNLLFSNPGQVQAKTAADAVIGFINGSNDCCAGEISSVGTGGFSQAAMIAQTPIPLSPETLPQDSVKDSNVGSIVVICLFLFFVCASCCTIIIYFRGGQSPSSNSNNSTQSNPGRTKTVWDESIFQDFIYKTGINQYQQAIRLYQRTPEYASQDFEKAFHTLQKLVKKYSNNPYLYFQMLEAAMGFDYEVAIANGYKFVELIEGGNFGHEHVGTIYDISRKMFKLLLMMGQFEEAKRFTRETILASNTILKMADNEMVEREHYFACYFYDNLSKGNYSVQRNIVTGFDGPEPWYHFDNNNEPDIHRKIQTWTGQAAS
jgi:hypothetical protein